MSYLTDPSSERPPGHVLNDQACYGCGVYHPAWDQVPGSTNVGYSHAEKDPNPTSAENFLIIGHFSAPSGSFLRGTPILPVLRAETLLGGGCHPRTTCMTIKDGPTHTRRLGSKTPRRSFAGAQDPMHFFLREDHFLFFGSQGRGLAAPVLPLEG